mgnify:CR=1 FL=1
MAVQPRTDDTESSPLLNEHNGPAGIENAILKDARNKPDIALVTKIASTMVSFSTLGLFNSSIGAVLPLISHYYSLTDLHVSILFLTGPIGYILAAQCSDAVHHRFGPRGIAFAGPVFHIAATALIALHPPFGCILVAFALQGLGTGLLDGSWCAWAGSMEKANTISGMLHGSYSIGGAAGPFLVAIVTTKDLPWYTWYYILVSFFGNSASRHADRPTRSCNQFLNYWFCCMHFGTIQHLCIVKESSRALPIRRLMQESSSAIAPHGCAQRTSSRTLAQRRPFPIGSSHL